MPVLTLAGQTVHLLAQKAIFLPARRTLVLADTHFGKSATFRARGLPVPEGDTFADLTRMADLIEATGAEHLIVAGDLLHSPDGNSPAVLAPLHAWIRSSPARFTLVCGNHDTRAGGLPAAWKIAAHASLDLDGLLIVHKPTDVPPGQPAIAGHLHPTVHLNDGNRTSLRLPVFWLNGQTLVLPAFGSLTGGQQIHPGPDDRLFTPIRATVTEIPLRLL